MKEKCFKCFVLLLLIYKVFGLIHTPQKIISNNNHKDMQIVHSYAVYQDHSVQKYPHTNNGGGKVCDLAFFLCKSIIFFEITKFMHEITKVHVSKGINPYSFCLAMKLFVLLLSYLLYRVLCIPR